MCPWKNVISTFLSRNLNHFSQTKLISSCNRICMVFAEPSAAHILWTKLKVNTFFRDQRAPTTHQNGEHSLKIEGTINIWDKIEINIKHVANLQIEVQYQASVGRYSQKYDVYLIFGQIPKRCSRKAFKEHKKI